MNEVGTNNFTNATPKPENSYKIYQETIKMNEVATTTQGLLDELKCRLDDFMHKDVNEQVEPKTCTHETYDPTTKFESELFRIREKLELTRNNLENILLRLEINSIV